MRSTTRAKPLTLMPLLSNCIRAVAFASEERSTGMQTWRGENVMSLPASRRARDGKAGRRGAGVESTPMMKVEQRQRKRRHRRMPLSSS
jgi:hypothetical protein